MTNTGPLVQTRVLDLSSLLPGPYCSRILADYGAEVIKIERPSGGDWLRYVPPRDPESGEGLLFRTLNRGKMSLTLNLKSDQGRTILLELVETANVLLEGFRPDVMERLGLGYERLIQANPGLIYCALTGYGSDGPYRNRAGHDLNYIGLAGLLDLTGPRDGPPAIPGTPVADLMGAQWAAIGILMGLLARQRTGKGQRVDGSLLGGALACMPVALAQHQGGEPIGRGANDLTGGVVCYNVYETQDGKYVTLGALEPQFWATFCQAVGREEWLGHQFSSAVPGESVYDEVCALFRSRTRREWAEALSGADACCEPVYTLGEALVSPPVQALGILTEGGLLAPARLNAQPVTAAEPAPTLGQHTTAILHELGYDETMVTNLRARGVV